MRNSETFETLEEAKRKTQYPLNYKILEQVKVALYCKELMFGEGKPKYRLLKPAEGYDFTYYKTFRELIHTHLLNTLRQPGDKMYLLFKDLVIEVTKADDILPHLKIGKDLQDPESYNLNISAYCVKVTYHNKPYAVPSMPRNTIITVNSIEHQVGLLID